VIETVLSFPCEDSDNDDDNDDGVVLFFPVCDFLNIWQTRENDSKIK
jgi:hypothetical protein